MSDKDIHTTVRIPIEMDNKIVETVTEINKKRDENRRNSWPGTVATKSDWIRDAIKEKLKNDTPLETLLERYNELRSGYDYKFEDEEVQYENVVGDYTCVEHELTDLWERALLEIRHKGFKTNELYGIQDKIDELKTKLLEYGMGFAMSRTYTFYQDVSLGDRIKSIICNNHFQIKVIGDNDDSKLINMDFNGVRWVERGYRKIPADK